MVCLTERSVTPVNGADLRFCRNLIPFFLCFSNASVFVVILLKILMVVFDEWRCGVMSGGRKSDVFMEILRILCLEFAFAVLLAFIVCLVGGLLFMVVG